jgi:hypothetical protein
LLLTGKLKSNAAENGLCNVLKLLQSILYQAPCNAMILKIDGGGGYPFCNIAKDLSIEARIIDVADMYQALTQKRSYRDKFHPKDVMSLLKNQMQEGEFDKDVVLMVEKNLAACCKIAN